MPPPLTPNRALAELAAMLGDDNVRALVRTFLRDFPLGCKELGGGARSNRHRIAHSMKSSSRLMGAHDLSQRLAGFEARLADEHGHDLTPQELADIAREFETIAAPLRVFAGADPIPPATAKSPAQVSTNPA